MSKEFQFFLSVTLWYLSHVILLYTLFYEMMMIIVMVDI